MTAAPTASLQRQRGGQRRMGLAQVVANREGAGEGQRFI